MDIAPIHPHGEIDSLITSRAYRCIFLLPYSPEFNPYWVILGDVKNKVKNKEDPSYTGIAEAM